VLKRYEACIFFLNGIVTLNWHFEHRL